MRPIATFGIIAVLWVLLVPRIAFAEDYIVDAAQALQRAVVYVAPGTERTDKDTAGKLQARLNSDDNIVLIMLPAKAEAELGADVSTIATRISEELGNQRIIGLAIGNKVAGYAPSLPSGVAADQMRRAQSVSNDPITALGTFSQNIHIWQRDHPQPKPIIPVLSQKNSPLDLPIALAPAIAVVAGVAFIIRRRMNNARSDTNRSRFNAPSQVNDLLGKIAQERKRIEDRELKEVLYQLCVDIEKYFASSSKQKERDTRFFVERLTEVTNVLAKYIEVQNNQRYYYEPTAELNRGREGINDFSVYVLDSIRRGQAADLLDYTVNTKILQAQRYR